MNMGVFPSGQWGQTVNLLLSASVVRIHPRPPRTPVSNGYRSFCFISFEKGTARVDSNSSGADRRLRRKQGGEAGAALRFFKALPRGCGKAASATRKTRRIVRRVKKPLRGFFRFAARDIHPRPPKKRNVSKYAAVFFTILFPAISASPTCQSSCARILFCTISPAGVRARVRPSKVAYPARTQFCTKASCAVENCLPYRAL